MPLKLSHSTELEFIYTALFSEVLQIRLAIHKMLKDININLGHLSRQTDMLPLCLYGNSDIISCLP